MQFRHPELLYALFLLLIPIIVHLFQLRKFKTEAFTNVAFLKKIKTQTRKSNSVKKWLVLLTRMGLLAAIVFAFAQPFIPQSDIATLPKETIIYLDNSYSMQAKGPSGQLLKTAAQDLITNLQEDQKFTLLTNNAAFRNTTVKDIRNDLLQLPFTATQLSEEAVTLKAQKEFTNDPSTSKRLILISDYQEKGTPYQLPASNVLKNYIQLQPVLKNNVSIDSIYVSARKASGLELTVLLSTLEKRETNTAVSLYNGNTLLAKGTASFNDDLTTSVLFTIKSEDGLEGRVVIDDPLLQFDNTLFFTINKDRPIRVLAINGGNSNYLQRIFTAPEFEYTTTTLKDLDYSKIPEANYVILNEVTDIPSSLIGVIDAFAKAGGICTIIPNSTTSPNAYNLTLQNLASLQVTAKQNEKQLVTTINYDHPIYRDVFDTRIDNFQYPSVSESYAIAGGDPILKFQDGSTFLTAQNGIYAFSGSLSQENSNFKSSPLIVPTFYNMARQSLQLPDLYMNTGITNTYDIPLVLQDDEVITLEQSTAQENNFIPLQQSKGSRVQITTTQRPQVAGNYNVQYGTNTLQQVSYNYTRSESNLRYAQLDNDKNYHTSIKSLFDKFESSDNVQSLWKWFIIFALLFLLLEILILKFYK